jgi:hypothetical protein
MLLMPCSLRQLCFYAHELACRASRGASARGNQGKHDNPVQHLKHTHYQVTCLEHPPNPHQQTWHKSKKASSLSIALLPSF